MSYSFGVPMILKMTDLHRKIITIDHRLNAESHLFFCSSYLLILVVIKDSRLYLGKVVFFR